MIRSMTTRNGRASRLREQGVGDDTSPEATGEDHGSGRGIWRDLLKGLLFIGLMLVVKLAVEHTSVGKQIHLASYNLLQAQLSTDHLPVTVVDISDIQPEKFDINGQVGTATPREPLLRMIEAIAEHEPKAIGVDIDFSPDGDFIHPRDPEFFQACLDMKRQRGVPIFLGIRRTMGRPQVEWLGDERYKELAANILIPNDSRRMLSEVEVGGNQSGVASGSPAPSKAMSVALADAYGSGAGRSHGWFDRVRGHVIGALERVGFVEKISERRLGPGLTVRDFLIDFSPLEEIKPIRTTNPVVLRDQSLRERFQGNVVLLGDGSMNKATDPFIVPGREQPYSGVFLHACAAYTLIKVPLYEVTGKGRIAIDVLFLLAILLTITFIRLHYRNRTAEEIATHRLQGFLTGFVVFAALIVGFVFVRVTRVMWDDFSLALGALILHPWIERQAEGFWGKLREHVPALLRRLIFKGNGRRPN